MVFLVWPVTVMHNARKMSESKDEVVWLQVNNSGEFIPFFNMFYFIDGTLGFITINFKKWKFSMH